MEKILIGDEPVARVYNQGELTYPNPVKDGLVLWYDFMGRQNSDAKRGIAEDLSGNGNDGELVNFAFEEGSGYERGLRFDGVDDGVSFSYNLTDTQDLTLEITFDLLKETGNAYTSVLRYGSSDYIMFRSFSSDDMRVTFFGGAFNLPTDSKVGTHNLTFSYNTQINTLKCYEKGVLMFERVGENYFNYPSCNLFDYSSYSANAILCGMKVYNRALTPEEIQHNYQMEKARWNL